MADDVELVFCRVCGASVPRKDLDGGLAQDLDGKVLCAACVGRIASAVERPAGRDEREVSSSLWIGVCLLFVTVLATAWFLDERSRRRADPLSGRLAGVEGRLTALAEALRSTGGERERALRADLDLLRSDLLARIDEIRGGVALLQGARKRPPAVPPALERKLRDLEDQLADLAARQAAFEGALADGFARLEQKLAERPAERPAAPAAAVERPPAAPPLAATLPKELAAAIARLRSKDPAERWTAVDELGRAGDPKAVPHLLPMLRDEDGFVRRRTAQALGELGDKRAVPALVDALEDRETIVRAAAYRSLLKLTRARLPFDAEASAAKRKAAVRRWRKWLAAHPVD